MPRGHRRYVILTLLMFGLLRTVTGYVEIQVKPYPALIYQYAPPNTPVLNIKAYDVETDQPLSKVSITNGADGEYFDVTQQARFPKEWVLSVKKQIDKPMGYVYDFNVYGLFNGTARDRNVRINVTEKNIFSPSFEKENYEFLALRNGWQQHLTLIGTVKAIDLDKQFYNSEFHYHIDPVASMYFHVDLLTGDIELIDDLPLDVDNMTFTVTAIDGGSPQLLNTTTVTVQITDVPPPDIFCVAVDENVARICWKDPTNGSYVMKYELLFQLDGQNTTTIPVHVNGVRDETCSIVRGAQLNRNYTFTVRVFNGLEWSPESLQRKVIVTRKGLYGDCPSFSNCSVWEPCKNKGECLVNDDLSYTCNCTQGWGGENCTGVDLCPTNPCNNGTCKYKDDKEVTCNCPGDAYGNYCQYFNICSESPCRNRGECQMLENESFTCTCAKHFVGELCETRDPCTPSPCLPHGQCSAVDSYNHECNCSKGHFGRNCEFENTCELERACIGGTCQMPDTPKPGRQDVWCVCDHGYHGDQCETYNICEVAGNSICKNNGTCKYRESNSFECLCQGGHWGGECQHYNMCWEKPCVTGTCQNVSDDAFICQCDNGHFGQLCEHYDPCHEHPCLGESSKCTNISDTEFLCHCPKERYGPNCEHIDGCQIHFCHNNATCRNLTSSGDVACSCIPGYEGKFCTDYNPCLLTPCDNGGKCTNMSRDFVCACPEGFHGKTCQLKDPCVTKPCLNNGECKIGTDGESFWCFCPEHFYGEQCQNVQFCQLHEKCQNGATCTILDGMMSREVLLNVGPFNVIRANVSNRYTCLCPPGFSGTHCEKLSPCVNQPCGSGQCIQTFDDYVCDCPDGSRRKNCFSSFCEEEDGFYDRTGHYDWPATKSGVTASILCSYDPRDAYLVSLYKPRAVRECTATPDGRAYWKPPDTSQCKEMKADDVSKSLKDLDSWTKDASGLGAEEISNITTTLEDLFFFSFTDLEIAKTLTAVVGNLLDANETVIIESNSNDRASDRLLWLLEEYASSVKTDKPVSIETENINLQVINVTEPNKELLYTPKLEDDNKSSTTTGISMKLPPEVLASSKEENPRVQLYTFRSSSFFIPSDHVPEQEVVMKQWVVTAVVQGRHVSNLSTPVEIVIKNIEENHNHTCVYWNVYNNTWSSEGVKTEERGKNYTKCLSYHLTSFAVVLDPSPTYMLSEHHDQVLTFIAYIGSGISMVGLLLTIVTYALFRCLNREKSGKILLNLCTSMLFMNAAFILGSETSLSISGDSMCKVVAVLLHYFLLTTLMWMLVEAVNMYQALIKVFTKYSGYFMLKRCVAAWGIPAVIVTIILAIDDDNYKTSTELCFLSHGNPLAFYIGLMGPACLILLINTIVFVLVSRVILRPRFHGNVSPSDHLNPAQIRGAFTVMTLLGITWVFGPLAINEAKLVINYLFTILNSLQGFLIFIFRCCFNPEVRMAWILLIKTGKFKRRKGPIKAFISDTNSSKTESRGNGSVAETLKSNVFNSNSTGSQPNGVSNGVNKGVSNGVNGESHDKTTEGDMRNGQSPASKDLQAYFEDLNKYKGKSQYQNGRNSDQLLNGFGANDKITNGNLRIHSAPDVRNGSPYRNSDTFKNGTRVDQMYQPNGSPYRTDEPIGVTTIYTGKRNGTRRLTRYDIDSDEFTKL